MFLQYQSIIARKTAVVLLAIALISTARVSAEEEPLRNAYSKDNFVVREEMVPMRDGVKLYTLIISPKKNSGAFPVILKRTPYDASGALGSRMSYGLDVNRKSILGR